MLIEDGRHLEFPGTAQSRMAAQRQGQRPRLHRRLRRMALNYAAGGPGTGRATVMRTVSLCWWGLPSRRPVVGLECFQAVGELLAGKGLGACGADVGAETGDFPDRDEGV